MHKKRSEATLMHWVRTSYQQHEKKQSTRIFDYENLNKKLRYLLSTATNSFILSLLTNLRITKPIYREVALQKKVHCLVNLFTSIEKNAAIIKE